MYRTIRVSSSIIGRPSSLILRRNAYVRYKRSTSTAPSSAIKSSSTSSFTKSSPKTVVKSAASPIEQSQLSEPIKSDQPNSIAKPKDKPDVFQLHDAPLDTPSPVTNTASSTAAHVDWSDSFHGLGSQPFSREIIDILLAPIEPSDIEIKPDGLIYLPEIKYRRILNRAFGPGGWGMAPRSESMVLPGQISREYALVCHGRLVSIARGEQDYFGGQEKVTTALEGCKSNALMRCCKDLGIASELWDPSFIRKFKQKYCDEVFAEHATTKKKKKLWKL
ncbi:uncharacterized protein SPAPADRAFT_58009, partial [Spathaspora passalidarum NRRL Y-27907]